MTALEHPQFLARFEETFNRRLSLVGGAVATAPAEDEMRKQQARVDRPARAMAEGGYLESLVRLLRAEEARRLVALSAADRPPRCGRGEVDGASWRWAADMGVGFF